MQFPAAVTTDERGVKSLDYQSMIAPLIESIRELKHKTDTLESLTQTNAHRLQKLYTDSTQANK
jgi:hypothetical protein